MTRHELRRHVFCLLFQKNFHADDFSTQADIYLDEVKKEVSLSDKERTYILQKADKVLSYLDEIDRYIDASSNGRKLSRIANAELAILRLATYEALYDDDIPVSVALNEAIELAKDYGDEGGYTFVNGVLAQIVKGKDLP